MKLTQREKEELARELLPMLAPGMNRYARATLQSAAQDNRLFPTMAVRNGAVSEFVIPGDDVALLMDDGGDGFAQNATGDSLAAGQRVQVLMVPGGIGFIIGTQAAPPGDGALLVDQAGDGVLTGYNFLIPPGYRNLEYEFLWSPAATAGMTLSIRMNGDAGAAYVRSITARAYGGAVTTVDSVTDTQCLVSDGYEATRMVVAHGIIASYLLPIYKTVSVDTRTADGNASQYWGACLWPNVSPVTSIEVFTSTGAALSASSRLRIWGVN